MRLPILRIDMKTMDRTHILKLRAASILTIFLLLIPCFDGYPDTGDQSISGFVRDASNGETLIGVNVTIRGTSLGSTTNQGGFFQINRIPSNAFTIVFSYIGYKIQSVTVTPQKDKPDVLNITLEPEAVSGEAVEVVADRLTTTEIKTGHIAITPRKLKTVLPMAEPDLMRMLQTLPGVLTLSDFSSGLFIRGGTPDQNLILLDGTEVYGVNHLFGIFSAFDVDAIKRADLIKGGFSAQYGGRLSSVLDITNKNGNQNRVEGKTTISLISAKALLQGPVGKGSWFLSGRRTYIDYMVNTAKRLAKGETRQNLEQIPGYYFYDSHFKLYQDLNHRNKLALTAYLGRDKMRYAITPFDMTFQWGNRNVSGKWTHIFGPALFVNVHIAYSQYRVALDEDDALNKFHFRNALDDVTIRSDMETVIGESHALKIGIIYKHLDSRYMQQYIQHRFEVKSASRQASVYIHDTWQLSPVMEMDIGIRANAYDPIAYVNSFDEARFHGTWRLDWEPRLALRYHLTDRIALKAATGRYIQYVTIVPYGNADFSFMDFWFPNDNSFPPGSAIHAITGVEVALPFNTHLDCEVYLKTLPRLDAFNADANEAPRGTGLFYHGKGYALGMDVLLEKRAGRLSGWISYSLGRSRRTFPELNEGRPFFPKYDRTHIMHCIGTWRLSDHWTVNAGWTYATGQAYTQPAAHYQVQLPDRSMGIIIGEELNASRLPPYYHLDVGAEYSSIPGDGLIKRWSLNLQIYNCTNRRNIWFRRIDAEQHPPEETDIRMLPIIPTFGVSLEF